MGLLMNILLLWMVLISVLMLSDIVRAQLTDYGNIIIALCGFAATVSCIIANAWKARRDKSGGSV